MRKLGMLLIVVGVTTGPLLTILVMQAAMRGVETGVGESAVGLSINRALTAAALGVLIAASGLGMVLLSAYRSHQRQVKADRGR